jgi:hypothetical protein
MKKVIMGLILGVTTLSSVYAQDFRESVPFEVKLRFLDTLHAFITQPFLHVNCWLQMERPFPGMRAVAARKYNILFNRDDTPDGTFEISAGERFNYNLYNVQPYQLGAMHVDFTPDDTEWPINRVDIHCVYNW